MLVIALNDHRLSPGLENMFWDTQTYSFCRVGEIHFVVVNGGQGPQMDAW